MKKLLILLISLSLLSSKCLRDGKSKVNPGYCQEGFEFKYFINSPDTIFSLSRDLTEISGLTYSDSSNRLLAVNDEDGLLFQINPNTGEVVEKTDFGKSDDYEGIAYTNGMIYIVESNGNIKVIDERTVKKIDEFDDALSKDNDVEGLCYHPASNSILMAAKGDSKIDGNDKSEKSIFSMDIESGEINKDPYVSMNLIKIIKDLEPQHIANNVLIDFSVNKRLKDFGPSGIAHHPITNDLYILSAKGKLLVVMNQFKKVVAVIFLNQTLHAQPEGICFDPGGNLYISNEGRSRRGKIFKYTVQDMNEVQ